MIAGTVLGRVGARRGRHRPPPQLLDPAGRPRGAADRPEADPRRLEAARGDGDLPRQGQEPVPRRSWAAPECCCSPRRRSSAGPRRRAHRRLRLRPQRHPQRPDRPARAGDPRVPGREGLPADGHLAEVRPRLLHRRAATSPTTAPATRSTSRSINGVPVLGHQGPGTLTDALLKEVLRLQGTMAPGGADLARGPRRAELRPPDHADHVHIGWQPPCTRAGTGAAVRAAAEAEPVAATDRPPRRDRQPGGADLALRAARCPASPTRARRPGGGGVAKAATERPASPRRSRRIGSPGPSSSDSRSSSSPATLGPGGRPLSGRATAGRRPRRRACWWSRRSGAPRPAGAAARRPARPTRARRRRCR